MIKASRQLDYRREMKCLGNGRGTSPGHHHKRTVRFNPVIQKAQSGGKIFTSGSETSSEVPFRTDSPYFVQSYRGSVSGSLSYTSIGDVNLNPQVSSSAVGRYVLGIT